MCAAWAAPKGKSVKIYGNGLMKTNFKPLCLITALVGLAAGATGQTLTTLVNFNGSDGASPQAGLVASGSMLYGTTYAGGSSNAGTVFAINTSNGGFSTLYSFLGESDGRGPVAGLVLLNNWLYGTATMGGTGNGTVFAINTNNGAYSNVYTFLGGSDGADPEAGLVLAGNTLYGTTFLGGEYGGGSVFRVNTDGSGISNVYSFSGGTNGSNPEAGLVLSGGTLYGTTSGLYGGGSSYGTVFRVNTDGSSFSNIYNFTGRTDGACPEAALVLSGGTLYGTAIEDGSLNNGTVFSVETNGSGFQSYDFTYDDGANPQATLLLVGNTLYGTTTNGGSAGWGTVFQINTNGSGGISNLYSFTDGSDGSAPEAGLVLLGSSLYGTAATGGTNGVGSVFALNLPGLAAVSLSIALNGGQVTLSWSSAAFSLQSAPTLNGVYTNVPGAASPYTTAAGAQQQFFRLKEN
jgi:uncharacterized repeat protein (TIGR03803 family)